MIGVKMEITVSNKTKLYRGNHVAKDLRTPKYRMRVVPLEKVYSRKKFNLKDYV